MYYIQLINSQDIANKVLLGGDVVQISVVYPQA